MSRRARLGAGVRAVAILLGGCGANQASTQPVRNKVTGTSDAPPLVSMRRIDGDAGFGSTPSTEYILFTPGHVLETAKGHAPPRLAGLTNTLTS
jgi:hypothetical protein